MAAKTHFSPRLFRFLRDLGLNNERAWFQENKDRYERDVKEPLLTFIQDFAPHLRKISPRYVADPRPVGGSMFRIHRDTRFSKDKTPYKTHASAHFKHEAAKDVHSPGFYLHLEPKSVFVGVGIWHPEAELLRQIREAIVSDPKGWAKAKKSSASAPLEMAGDSLVRPPKGFDQDHPLIEDLRRKDFIAVAKLSEKDALSPGFLNRFAEVCRAGAPFMRFLTQSLDLPW